MFSKFDIMYTKKLVEWKEDSLIQNMQSAFVTGTPLGSVDAIKGFVRDWTQDLTFLEVYERNGWTLAITVTDELGGQRLLNYLTSPHVVIWSAVVCSCAIPEFYGAQELFIKNSKTGNLEHYHSLELNQPHEYLDGSISGDVPT